MNTAFVEDLFFEQMKQVTLDSLENSYEFQFSEAWLDNQLQKVEYERELCSMRGM